MIKFVMEQSLHHLEDINLSTSSTNLLQRIESWRFSNHSQQAHCLWLNSYFSGNIKKKERLRISTTQLAIKRQEKLLTVANASKPSIVGGSIFSAWTVIQKENNII